MDFVARIAVTALFLIAGVKLTNMLLRLLLLTALGQKIYPRKSNDVTGYLPFATTIFVEYDLDLVRMHLEGALRKPCIKRRHQGLHLRLGPTMDQPIIRLPAPGVVRIVFRHPDVKRMVEGWPTPA